VVHLDAGFAVFPRARRAPGYFLAQLDRPRQLLVAPHIAIYPMRVLAGIAFGYLISSRRDNRPRSDPRPGSDLRPRANASTATSITTCFMRQKSTVRFQRTNRGV
jgi:hypothetical protein